MSEGYGPMEWYGHKDIDGKCACGVVRGSHTVTDICPYAEYIHISVLESEIGKLLEMGKLKSGKKIQRKIGQFYGRQIRKNTEISVNKMARSFEDHLKPKPKWLPTWMYRKVMKIFITI